MVELGIGGLAQMDEQRSHVDDAGTCSPNCSESPPAITTIVRSLVPAGVATEDWLNAW